MANESHQMVVFLDIDGVLNTVTTHPDTIFFYPRNLSIRLKLFNNFVKLYKKYNFFVVISSAWRIVGNSRAIIMDLLKNNDISVIGFTTILPITDKNEDPSINRSAEILEWIESNQLKNYMIIDDLPLQLNPNKFIHTYFNHGLTDQKVLEFETKADVFFK